MEFKSVQFFYDANMNILFQYIINHIRKYETNLDKLQRIFKCDGYRKLNFKKYVKNIRALQTIFHLCFYFIKCDEIKVSRNWQRCLQRLHTFISLYHFLDILLIYFLEFLLPVSLCCSACFGYLIFSFFSHAPSSVLSSRLFNYLQPIYL